MSTVLTSKELRGMQPAALKKAVKKLVSSTRMNAAEQAKRAKQLKAEIEAFERKHGMLTKKMLDMVCAGTLKEEGEIELWLITYNLFRLHAKA